MTFWSWMFSSRAPYWVRWFFFSGIALVCGVLAGLSMTVDWKIGVIGVVLLSLSLVTISIREYRRHVVDTVFNEVRGNGDRG